MNGIMFWIAGILLALSALLLIWNLIQKQKEAKSSSLDMLSVVLAGFIIFIGGYMAFTWLGEFQSGSQSGMLSSGSNLFKAIMDKAAAEITAPGANPFKKP